AAAAQTTANTGVANAAAAQTTANAANAAAAAAQTTANNAATSAAVVMGFAQSIDARVTQQEVELQYLQVNSTPSGNNAPASDGNARPDAAPPVAASATGSDAIAIGSASVAAGANSVAIGVGANASQANTTALGVGATTTRAGQVKLGGAGSSVSVGDIVQSTAAQSGTTEVMTVDASGTIGRDTTIRPMLTMHNTQISAMQALSATHTMQIAELQSGQNRLTDMVARNNSEARGGIAAAVALTPASMPSVAGRTAYTVNFGVFHDETAIGASFAHRFDTEKPMALTAGFSSSGNESVGRIGIAGEF
ncbi:MAG: hemagluttinin-like protein, partial [Hyphomonadaceae bacterium]